MDIFDLPPARVANLPAWAKARRGATESGPVTILYWQEDDAVFHVQVKGKRLSPDLRKVALNNLGMAIFCHRFGGAAYQRTVLARARARAWDMVGQSGTLTGEDLRLANELAKYTIH